MDKSTQTVSLVIVAWRRGAARLLDFILGYTLWILPAVLIAYQCFVPVTPATSTAYAWVLLAIMLVGIPVSFILEAVWYRLWGPTPGKRLYALRVVDVKGKQLSSGDYNARLLRLYCSGVLFGIPVFSQIGKCIQAGCFLNRGTTTYDDGRYQVLINTPSVAQIVVWTCLFTGAPALLQVLNIAAVTAGY